MRDTLGCETVTRLPPGPYESRTEAACAGYPQTSRASLVTIVVKRFAKLAKSFRSVCEIERLRTGVLRLRP